jgi:hypothetical protein
MPETPHAGAQVDPAVQQERGRAVPQVMEALTGSPCFLQKPAQVQIDVRSIQRRAPAEVHTRPQSCQSSPATARFSACRACCALRAAIAIAGSGMVRRELAVFGSTNVGRPSTRWSDCRTVTAPTVQSISYQRSPKSSPWRMPVAITI